jgi:2-amino-4-hydroxy-6-hydroxymethyldihydropteridine diphosphokinase
MHSCEAILSIGSNMELREEHLLKAVTRLERDPSVTLTGFSPLYETEPVGVRTSACFVNAVVRIEFDGTPRRLLRLCRQLEERAGRKGPGPDRPLDIDIIIFGDILVEEPDLVIPHPRFRERLFVLVPMADIAPDLLLPPDGRTAPELARSDCLKGWIRRISCRSTQRSG